MPKPVGSATVDFLSCEPEDGGFVTFPRKADWHSNFAHKLVSHATQPFRVRQGSKLCLSVLYSTAYPGRMFFTAQTRCLQIQPD